MQLQELCVASATANLAEIAGFVAERAALAGLDEERVFAVQMAVDEACTNAMQHAYEGRADGEVRICCYVDDGDFVVQIFDHGKRFDPEAVPEPDLASPLTHRLELPRSLHQDLAFLLRHYDRPRQAITGEVGLLSLEPLLSAQDPPLVEALFLLTVVTTAAREEGVLTEDLLERLFALQNQLRNLTRNSQNARWAQERLVEDNARRHLACEHYLEIQRGEAPTASLRQLLESTRLPNIEPERGNLLEQGRLSTGLDRLLRLRGLTHVSALDLTLLRADVPVPFIYRLKGLRSVGITHFERDLSRGVFRDHDLRHARQRLAALAHLGGVAAGQNYARR